MKDGDGVADVTVLRPFAVNLDWLTMNMRGPVSLGAHHQAQEWIGGLWLLPTELRTSTFRRVMYLVDRDGDKLLTLWCDPHTEKMGPRDWYQVQFHNRTLYSGAWRLYFDQLRQMGFTYKGVSRIDFAADGLQGECDYLSVMSRAFTGDVDYYGKALWNPVVQHKRVRNAELGTRASNKFLRCYDKSREMKDPARDKPHIRDAWRSILGVDPEDLKQAVMRLEVQMKGTEVRRYYPEERRASWVESLTDKNARAEAFDSTVSTMFDFRHPAPRARDAKTAVRWDWAQAVDGDTMEIREREPRTLTMGINTLKSNVRTNYLIHLATGDPLYLQLARQVCEAAGLDRWFLKAETEWRREFLFLSGTKRRRDGSTTDQATLDLFHRLRL